MKPNPLRAPLDKWNIDKKKEILLLGGLSLLVGLIFFPWVYPLGVYSFTHPVYSYIPLIPLVSFCLFVWERRRIFSGRPTKNLYGLFLLVPGFLMLALGFYLKNPNASGTTQASILIISAVLFWMAGFVLVFGGNRFLRARFTIGFLIFLVPMPEFLMDAVVTHLQWGSAYVLEKMLWLTPVPNLRDGLTFHFSTVSINVARECSGIRTSLSLVIAVYLISGLYLKRWGDGILLFLSLYPVILFKNSLRILVVSLLGEYVDVSFITHGFVHKSGGFIFFGMALFIILLIAYWRHTVSSKDRIPAGAQK